MTSHEPEAVRDRFADRLFQASIAAFDLFHVYVGDRLALYRTLAARGQLTPQELADAAGIAERYAREWLEHEAVAGVLEVAADAADPTARRFRLPEAHAEVLLDADSLSLQFIRVRWGSGLPPRAAKPPPTLCLPTQGHGPPRTVSAGSLPNGQGPSSR